MATIEGSLDMSTQEAIVGRQNPDPMTVDRPADPPLRIMCSRRSEKPCAFKSTGPRKRKIGWGATSAAGSKKTQKKKAIGGGGAAGSKKTQKKKALGGGGAAGSKKTQVSTMSKKGPEVTRVCHEKATDDIRPTDDLDTGLDGVMSFNDFNIFIDGLVADDHQLFPDRLRRAYFQLCCDRKTLLHQKLQREINAVLVVGVIVQTVIISEGIKAFSFSSPTAREDLVAWSKILEFLELMGMDLAFLRQSVVDLRRTLSAQSRPCTARGTQRPKKRTAAQQ